MVVAVAIVGMMKMAINEVVDMIPMGNGRVPTARTVDVIGIVSSTAMLRGACCGVGVIFTDDVLIDVIPVGMMQVAIMEVVDVAIMENRQMATVLAMDMGVVGVLGTRHGIFLFKRYRIRLS